MELTKLKVTKTQLDEINETSSSPTQPVSCGYRRNRRIPGQKFEDRHKRITLYFENPVYDEIELLRDQGVVQNVTALVNDALRMYLFQKYGSKLATPSA